MKARSPLGDKKSLAYLLNLIIIEGSSIISDDHSGNTESQMIWWIIKRATVAFLIKANDMASIGLVDYSVFSDGFGLLFEVSTCCFEVFILRFRPAV